MNTNGLDKGIFVDHLSTRHQLFSVSFLCEIFFRKFSRKNTNSANTLNRYLKLKESQSWLCAAGNEWWCILLQITGVRPGLQFWTGLWSRGGGLWGKLDASYLCWHTWRLVPSILDLNMFFFFFLISCGFLQPDQHAVRHHHRFLHRGKLSSHVRWS